jgi:trans-aconitate methyltransferase
MEQEEAVSLIRAGVSGMQPQSWADLGCGRGVFTFALKSLLPAGSRLIAVDKESQRLPLHFIKGDFEKDELPLSRLDGILMANSLHFVRDKEKLIRKLEAYFLATPAFLIVEYDTDRANRWVPYPVSSDELRSLFTGLGYSSITKLEVRPSRFGGQLYAALIKKDVS